MYTNTVHLKGIAQGHVTGPSGAYLILETQHTPAFDERGPERPRTVQVKVRLAGNLRRNVSLFAKAGEPIEVHGYLERNGQVVADTISLPASGDHRPSDEKSERPKGRV